VPRNEASALQKASKRHLPASSNCIFFDHDGLDHNGLAHHDPPLPTYIEYRAFSFHSKKRVSSLTRRHSLTFINVTCVVSSHARRDYNSSSLQTLCRPAITLPVCARTNTYSFLLRSYVCSRPLSHTFTLAPSLTLPRSEKNQSGLTRNEENHVPSRSS